MGNVSAESSWNPMRRGSGRSYWGLFQINKDLSIALESKYKEAGLDISLYGYNAKKYQGYNEWKNIPQEDMGTILDIQLKYILGVKPTGKNWISELKKANSVELASETFQVCFEGNTTKTTPKTDENRIEYYEPAKGKYYGGAAKRRELSLELYNNMK